jgi:hypothetical protein
MSSAVNDRKVGAAADPVVGPAKIVLAVWVARLTASVPLVVIGEPVTLRKFGTVRATLVTVPPARPAISFCTHAVVATAVELSSAAGVVAVADDPRATVEENVTPPENVYVPAAVCVRPLDNPKNAPGPNTATTEVAEPPAPPVPVP